MRQIVLFFLALALALGSLVNLPAATITIGSGTDTTTSLPISTLNGYTYSQQIYTKAQINGAGFNDRGVIEKILFNYASGDATLTYYSSNWDIYIGHTTKTGFTSTSDWVPLAAMTKVYSGTVDPTATGWLTVVLTTPFVYNNANNLVIAIDENSSPASTTYTAASWGSFISGTNTGLYYRSGSINPNPASPPTGTRTATINRFSLEIEAVTVDPPSAHRFVQVGSSKAVAFTISNPSSQNVTLNSVTGSAAWLSYTPPTGTIPAGGTLPLQLTLNAGGNPSGYTATTNLTVNVTYNGSPLAITVPVRMTVANLPVNPRMIGQWEPARGAIIRYPWGIPNAMIEDLGDDDSLFVVVSSGNLSAAQSSLSRILGANLKADYIITNSNTYWARDWGPISIFEGPANDRRIKLIDFDYNRDNRDSDETIIPAIAADQDYAMYTIPLSLTGGNILTDGFHREFADIYVYEQNDGLPNSGLYTRGDGFTEIYSYTFPDFVELVEDYRGDLAEGFSFFPDPTGDYIHHIDCWAKLISVDTVVLLRVPATHPHYDEIQAMHDQWASLTSSYGTPFNVYYVDCPNDEAYVNSFILNDEIFIPYAGTAQDATALAQWQAAAASVSSKSGGKVAYTVTGYIARTGYPWLPTDAIHCRVNTLFRTQEEPTLPVELSSFTASISVDNFVNLTWVTQSETNVQGFYVLRNTADDLAGAAVISDLIQATNTSQQQTYIYKDTELYEDDSYYYWLQSSDMDGSMDFFGPVSVNFSTSSNNAPQIPLVTQLLNIYPNPFNPIAYLPFEVAATAPVRFDIYNSRGQLVRALDLGSRVPGRYKQEWDGRDNTGQQCGTGIYFVRMTAGKASYLRKAVLMK